MPLLINCYKKTSISGSHHIIATNDPNAIYGQNGISWFLVKGSDISPTTAPMIKDSEKVRNACNGLRYKPKAKAKVTSPSPKPLPFVRT